MSTLAAVCFHYRMPPADARRLTVAEFNALVEQMGGEG